MRSFQCLHHILNENENLENILSNSQEVGHFFENKEGLKVLGYFPIKENISDAPYSFYYQSFESEFPVFINCSLILVQKERDLWVYEREGFSQSFEKNFRSYLSLERKLEDLGTFKTSLGTSFEEWKQSLVSILKTIKDQTNPVSKVVLSRNICLTSDRDDCDSSLIFSHLRKDQNNTFKIFFPITESSTFLSFTPERILLSDGKNIYLEAIAGTRPRGNSEIEDLKLEKELKESSKESNEHQKVVEQIVENVQSLGSIKMGERSILKLKGLQHLKTPIEVHCKSNIDSLALSEIVKTLHPTPAVGGTPQKEAKDIIFQLEGLRESYAGLFGIVSSEHTEIAVLIRSAKIENNNIIAYAGAGIVEGSDPESEWKETETKLRSFLGGLL